VGKSTAFFREFSADCAGSRSGIGVHDESAWCRAVLPIALSQPVQQTGFGLGLEFDPAKPRDAAHRHECGGGGGEPVAEVVVEFVTGVELDDAAAWGQPVNDASSRS